MDEGSVFIDFVLLLSLPVINWYFMAMRRQHVEGSYRVGFRGAYLLSAGALIFINQYWNSLVNTGLGQWAWWGILAMTSWVMLMAAYEIVKGRPKKKAAA